MMELMIPKVHEKKNLTKTLGNKIKHMEKRIKILKSIKIIENKIEKLKNPEQKRKLFLSLNKKFLEMINLGQE